MAVGEARVGQGGDRGLRHTAGAEDGEVVRRRDPVGRKEIADGEVVGVVGDEVAVVVDDGVDRLDRCRGLGHLVDQRYDVLIPRHRDRTSPDFEGAHATGNWSNGITTAARVNVSTDWLA